MIRDNPPKPWQQPPPPEPINLQTLMGIHQYLHNLATRSATMEACLTHIEHQLHTAITGIIVTTQGPTK